MKLKVYDFKKKIGLLGDIKFEVSDYFDFYHTGIESIIPKEMIMITERYNNERSEVLAYNFLETANLADLILAINNDVFLWDSPYDNDMYETEVEVIYDYIRKINKTLPDRFRDDKFKEVAREYTESDDSILRSVVLPKRQFTQKIQRIINDYKKSRELQ